MNSKALSKTARRLRQNQTKHERQFVRILQYLHVRFQSQKIIGPWIADFYLPDYQLIIELDGSGHHSRSGIQRDFRRDAWFRQNDFRIIHINNADIYRTDLMELIQGNEHKPIDKDFYTIYLKSL